MKRKLIAPLLVGLAALGLAAFAWSTPRSVEAGPAAQQTQSATTAPAAQPTQSEATAPAAQPTQSGAATPAAAGTQAPSAQGRTINVLSGSGRETIAVNAYFPFEIKVRVGDTVKWMHNTDEIHTVTFSDGKVPQGADPSTFVLDSRDDAGVDSMLPAPFVPLAGGSPTDVQLNPMVNFPTRQQGAPVETWNGTGFISSGVMSDEPQGPPGTPPNNTFEVTFTEPGIYRYICLIHYQSMQGVVQVIPADQTDVPTQADIDAQAKNEMAKYDKWIEQAKAVAEKEAPKELGPNNTTIWNVRNGNQVSDLVDMRAQLLQFGPQNLTIKVGDTVVWSSAYFHTVTFNPVPPPPDFIVATPQPNGPPLLLMNPKVVVASKPAAIYDPAVYYNSGIMNPGGRLGMTWSLTFDKPGTYEYICVVHYAQGMKGTITVTQ